LTTLFWGLKKNVRSAQTSGMELALAATLAKDSTEKQGNVFAPHKRQQTLMVNVTSNARKAKI